MYHPPSPSYAIRIGTVIRLRALQLSAARESFDPESMRASSWICKVRVGGDVRFPYLYFLGNALHMHLTGMESLCKTNIKFTEVVNQPRGAEDFILRKLAKRNVLSKMEQAVCNGPSLRGRNVTLDFLRLHPLKFFKTELYKALSNLIEVCLQDAAYSRAGKPDCVNDLCVRAKSDCYSSSH